MKRPTWTSKMEMILGCAVIVSVIACQPRRGFEAKNFADSKADVEAAEKATAEQKRIAEINKELAELKKRHEMLLVAMEQRGATPNSNSVATPEPPRVSEVNTAETEELKRQIAQLEAKVKELETAAEARQNQGSAGPSGGASGASGAASTPAPAPAPATPTAPAAAPTAVVAERSDLCVSIHPDNPSVADKICAVLWQNGVLKFEGEKPAEDDKYRLALQDNTRLLFSTDLTARLVQRKEEDPYTIGPVIEMALNASVKNSSAVTDFKAYKVITLNAQMLQKPNSGELGIASAEALKNIPVQEFLVLNKGGEEEKTILIRGICVGFKGADQGYWGCDQIYVLIEFKLADGPNALKSYYAAAVLQREADEAAGAVPEGGRPYKMIKKAGFSKAEETVAPTAPPAPVTPSGGDNMMAPGESDVG